MNNLAIHMGSRLLKALGNEKRLEILFYLEEKEMKVGDLEKLTGLSQSALSQHLALLRREELVKTRREAQTIYYAIRAEKVRKILRLLDDIYQHNYAK